MKFQEGKEFLKLIYYDNKIQMGILQFLKLIKNQLDKYNPFYKLKLK